MVPVCVGSYLAPGFGDGVASGFHIPGVNQ
jgi:hypothetical protein